jgi:hypothetical protein
MHMIRLRVKGEGVRVNGSFSFGFAVMLFVLASTRQRWQCLEGFTMATVRDGGTREA